VVEGQLVKPRRTGPCVAALQETGQAHEQRYVDWLRAQGLRVRDLGDVEDREARFARTEQAPRGMECRTPRKMQLANALCRFREIAG